MNNNENTNLIRLNRALRAIEKLQAKITELEKGQTESIAIIGMGCRFPGAENPEAFWELLENGKDAIAQVPSERWNIDDYYDSTPGMEGKINTRYGGFLDKVDEFDAHFFGISPREAISIDPQQRLILEVSWETLERAGIVPENLVGSQTGVFMGLSSNDYSQLLLTRKTTAIDAYLATGNSHSTAVGRLSFLLGFTGPSLAVDTACSSSLVTVHLACQSLRNRECKLALAGGVNLILSPDFSINFAQARMLSPDGRCKTFDESANGFVRSEGCGIVALKRLSDAVADGDNILAIIRGSAINQDGRSSGLTVPNGPSQQAVIRQALTNAQVNPDEIDYIEAHGTGTSLGDPIEIGALGAVFHSHNRQNPLIVGSVKTNIGHLEAAAGIAGLIKVVLSLQHEQIPPHLHLKQLNPYINWADFPLTIPTEGKTWANGTRQRLAGVSSFGFSGTNAHVVVEEGVSLLNPPLERGEVKPPSVPPNQGGGKNPESYHLFTLSAKSKSALRELTQIYHQFLQQQPDSCFGDICLSVKVRRSHFKHRLAILVQNKAELSDKLHNFENIADKAHVYLGNPENASPTKIAFLFTGQGSQYLDMGRELYETQPVFRQHCDRCFAILESYLDLPLKNIIYPQSGSRFKDSQDEQDYFNFPIPNSQILDQTIYTQPALFVIEYALAQLWMSWGVKPDVVIGHSIGEYVAATIAGVFNLEDGLKLVANRGRLMQELPPHGVMVAISADAEKVGKIIAPLQTKVAIATINSSENTVISGEKEAIAEAINKLEASNFKTKKLNVSHAFHSPLMEPILADFEGVAKEINYHKPQIKFISNLTGNLAQTDITTPQYWCNHIVQPVKFAEGIATLANLGKYTWIEVGAKPTLLGIIRTNPQYSQILALPSLRPNQENWESMLSSLAQLYVWGYKINWQGFEKGYQNHQVSLPTYPFQRQRYWFSPAKPKISASGQSREHFLLGNQLRLATSETIIWENYLNQRTPNYLEAHQVLEKVIFPSSGYVEMALTAGKIVTKSEEVYLQNIIIQQALVLLDSEVTVQLVLTKIGEQEYKFEILSLNFDLNWITHAQGNLSTGNQLNYTTTNLEQYRQEISQRINLNTYYQSLSERGLEYGLDFRVIAQLYSHDNRALGQIKLPDNLINEANHYIIHPVLLDACLQIAGATINEKNNSVTYLPIAIDSFQLYSNLSPLKEIWSYAEVRRENNGIYTIDFQLITDNNELVVEIEGLKIKPVNSTVIERQEASNWHNWLYQIEWSEHSITVNNANYLTKPITIKENLEAKFNQLISEPAITSYLELLPQLEFLSTAYIVEALQKLGLSLQIGDRFSTEEIIKQLNIVSEQRFLAKRCLDILVEEKTLEKLDNLWQVIKSPEEINLKTLHQQLLKRYPIAWAELSLLERCASQLDRVLPGKIDPIQLLFPNNDLNLTNYLYEQSPGAKITNTLVAEAIAQVLANKPSEYKVKILEIGAGTGGTTAYILPYLKNTNISYTFTDISPVFLAKAKDKFKDYNFLSYQLLDIEKSPQSQGFNLQEYNIIIAANVLHATLDLRQTLEHIQQLLSFQGILILLEGTKPLRWFDLTFGLTEGWWKFKKQSPINPLDKGGLRGDYPLISTSQWQNLLLDSGFEQPINLASSQNFPELSQAVIIAQSKSSKAFSDNWLIFVDRKGLGKQIVSHLELGNNCKLIFKGLVYKKLGEDKYVINPSNIDDYHRLFKDLQRVNYKLNRIVYFWNLDINVNPEKQLNSDTIAVIQKTQIKANLNLIQSLGSNCKILPKLWIVTQGSVPVEEVNLDGLLQSPLQGLGKVINLEYPEINCSFVDLDPNINLDRQIESLLLEITSSSQQEQVIWRNSNRQVARLVRYNSEAKISIPKTPYQLSITEKNSPKNLQFISTQRQQPKTGEVEIQVKATGLNFIDVLDTLGLLPFAKDWFGVECAGEIVSVGAQVNNFAVGDEVIAFATGCFSQFVTVNELMVVAKPKNLNWEEAAGIPANFLTASYALEKIAQISAGKRILIHAAAGGTGMAAVQLALQAGAEVFATASRGKWEFLQSLGIKHILNSRTLDFTDEIIKLTAGEGVDLVFNSLSGEFRERSIDLLTDNGCFLEIGKRDVWDIEKFKQIKPKATYHLIDLFTLAQEQPHLIQSLLKDLMTRFSTGKLQLLPYKVFPLEKTISAFSYMQQSKHIGKLVISHQVTKTEIRNNCSYLIAGGLGGLGLLVADWLVEKGAKNLILIGRSEPSQEAKQQLQELEKRGTKIAVLQADISKLEQLETALNSLPPDFPVLGGVIHAAGVLDDGMLLNLNWERMAKVMNPKVLGAWNLHTLTQNQPLDFFILFSSAASLLGSPGQGNHVAANTFLDFLAYYRQFLGLPGLSINWGAWGEIGAAAQRQVDKQMNLRGIGTIGPQQGLEVLEYLMTDSSPQVGVIPIDWSTFLTHKNITNSGFWDNFKTITSPTKLEQEDCRQKLTSIPQNEKKSFLITYLQTEVGKVLGLPSSQLPNPHQGFFDIGMDSLMAVELKNRLETNFGVPFPSTIIFEYPKIVDLADYILTEVLPTEDSQEELIDESVEQDQELDLETELESQIDSSEEQGELEISIAEELASLEKLLNGD